MRERMKQELIGTNEMGEGNGALPPDSCVALGSFLAFLSLLFLVCKVRELIDLS